MKLSSMKLIKLLLMLSALSPGTLSPAYGMEEKELWREQGARPKQGDWAKKEARPKQGDWAKKEARPKQGDWAKKEARPKSAAVSSAAREEAALDQSAQVIAKRFPRQMKSSVLAFFVKSQYLSRLEISVGPLKKKEEDYLDLMGQIKQAYPHGDTKLHEQILERSLGEKYFRELCNKVGSLLEYLSQVESTLKILKEPFNYDEKGKKFYKENKKKFKALGRRFLFAASLEADLAASLEALKESTRALVVAALKLGIAKKDYDNHKDKKEEISPFVEKYRGEFVAAEQNLKKDVEAFIENRLTDATPKDQRPTPSSPGGAHAF